MLADAGAAVTHIDPPEGPRWRSDANILLNRGKTCLSVDLKSAHGWAQASALVREADVVIENFAPGVMERLGFSAAAVKDINPRCIYLSMPGFRSDDEARAELKAFEAIILTESKCCHMLHICSDYIVLSNFSITEANLLCAGGVFADMGLNRTLMGVNPSYSPLPLASTYAAPMAANAVTAALIRREVTGIGDEIEVPLASCLHDTLVCTTIPGRLLHACCSDQAHDCFIPGRFTTPWTLSCRLATSASVSARSTVARRTVCP